MTIITEIKFIDFNNKEAIKKEIDDFTQKYAYADIEHALIISPNGNTYSLTGTKGNVNSEILGKEILRGSIIIHNHPVEYKAEQDDSFSFKDLKIANDYELGKQYVVSGKRRDAFELTQYHTIEIETAWDNAKYEMWEKHKKNDTEVVFEQQDILRELKIFLKGFKFYENI